MAEVSVEQIETALREVVDPEVGVNIVDLGLIYGVEVDAAGVHVRMTLTTPACPLGAFLVEEVRHVVRESAPEATVDVELVWSPRWSPDRMSPAAKRELGWGAGGQEGP